MDELEQLRTQKIAALRTQQRAAQEQQAELQQQVEALEALVKEYLDSAAVTRLGTLKLAHPEKALQAMVVIGQLVKAGKIKQPLTDEQFKDIIRMITPEKKQTTIKRT